MSRKPLGPNAALKKARESLGLSIEELAEQLDMPDKSLIKKWEEGRTAPGPEYRKKLRNLFKMSNKELGFLPTQDLSAPDSGASQLSEARGVEQGMSKPQPFQPRQLSDALNGTSEALGYPREHESIEEKASSPLSVEQLLFQEGPSSPSPARRRWLRVSIWVIVWLIIILPILGVGIKSAFPPSPPPPSCGGNSSDDFHGKLTSGWNRINFGNSMEGSTTYRPTKTSLNISTTTNSSLDLNPNLHSNPALNFTAPRFLRPITGNFTIETCLEFRPTRNFQSAGILLWQDQAHFMRFERAFGGPSHNPQSGIFLQAWNHKLKIYDSGLQNQLTTAGSVELRIQRKGDFFTASWSEPGQPWHTVGKFLFPLANLMVGVDLIDDYGAPPITASYTYFRISYP